jgi:hypothetical protein
MNAGLGGSAPTDHGRPSEAARSESTGAAEAAGEVADAVKDGAREAAESEEMGWIGRAGLAAHGAVYLLLGLVALLVAIGVERRQVDQRGAFNELASHSWGWLLLLLLTLGCAAYTVWLLSRATYGTAGTGERRFGRLQAALGGVGYALLTMSAASVLLGSRSSQGETQEALSARFMAIPGGVLLVGLAGLFVLALGGFMVSQGITARFMEDFRPVPGPLERVIRLLGRVGSLGRGIVVGLAGGLVVSAAWTFDPDKAGGIDLAFRTVLQEPYGRPLAVAAAAALLAFGLYGLAEAAYRRV